MVYICALVKEMLVTAPTERKDNTTFVMCVCVHVHVCVPGVCERVHVFACA